LQLSQENIALNAHRFHLKLICNAIKTKKRHKEVLIEINENGALFYIALNSALFPVFKIH